LLKNNYKMNGLARDGIGPQRARAKKVQF